MSYLSPHLQILLPRNTIQLYTYLVIDRPMITAQFDLPPLPHALILKVESIQSFAIKLAYNFCPSSQPLNSLPLTPALTSKILFTISPATYTYNLLSTLSSQTLLTSDLYLIHSYHPKNFACLSYLLHLIIRQVFLLFHYPGLEFSLCNILILFLYLSPKNLTSHCQLSSPYHYYSSHPFINLTLTVFFSLRIGLLAFTGI